MMHKGANASVWSTKALQAFERLKASFAAAPVLWHPNPKLPFTLEVDMSGSGVGALLSQWSSPEAPLMPCGFFSHKLSKAEILYDIGDRELLGIILALREWRHLLEGTSAPILILTDHKTLTYLSKAKRLSPRQSLSLPSPSTAAKKPHCFKSHSHLTSLSLLLLLAAGDISPNPGPPSILSCKPTPTQTRNIHNLLTVPCHLISSPPFCFGLWNARSVCNKLTAVHDLFISHSLNLLAITETWLTSSDTASTAALSHGGLHFTHTPRPGNSKGGGVGILLSPNHTFQIIPTVPSLSFPTFEAHTIRLFSPFPLRVAAIYRPPGPSVQFLDHFASWLPHFMSSDVPTLILGDFNIPVDNHNSHPAIKLLSLTTSFGLSQWTCTPTHSDGHSFDLGSSVFFVPAKAKLKGRIQVHHHVLRGNAELLDYLVSLSKEVIQDLIWWLDCSNLRKGKPFVVQYCTLVTTAFMDGELF
ncbi:uncharacterized protein WCC33_000867 [Rhinophrynus dorsalis]